MFRLNDPLFPASISFGPAFVCALIHTCRGLLQFYFVCLSPIILNSTSKEFGDIKALVMHTFMCQAVGLRSEHMGFHKALCVLIGWDSSYLPDTPWVPRQLSEAAASNLREGLIIWPPLVVIHNSSLEKPTSEERILISIEHVEEIIKGISWPFSSVLHPYREFDLIVDACSSHM